MSNNIKVLLVGAGYMGQEYAKVLKAQNIDFTVITRKQQTADSFESETGKKAVVDNLENFLKQNKDIFTHAINAVNVLPLVDITYKLIENGIKKILVEKPVSYELSALKKLSSFANKKDVSIYVAYNRRFYTSTSKAMEIIREDGGLKNLDFEFTEWLDKVKSSVHIKEEIDNLLIGNSSHVIDLAFYFAGLPKSYSFYSSNLFDNSNIYVGAGITENNVYFSYKANWNGPGRWGLELVTNKHRLYLRPMEKLAIQELNSVAVNEVEIDDKLDVDYKPGLYLETKDFLSDIPSAKLKTIAEQVESIKTYYEILKGTK